MNEVQKWEKENFNKITGWVSDFSIKKDFKIITFNLEDKSKKVFEINLMEKDPFEEFYDEL